MLNAVVELYAINSEIEKVFNNIFDKLKNIIAYYDKRLILKIVLLMNKYTQLLLN